MEIFFLHHNDLPRVIIAEELEKKAGWKVTDGDSAELALDLMGAFKYDFVVSCENLAPGKMTGLEFLAEIRKRDIQTPFLLLAIPPEENSLQKLDEQVQEQSGITCINQLDDELVNTIFKIIQENCGT